MNSLIVYILLIFVGGLGLKLYSLEKRVAHLEQTLTHEIIDIRDAMSDLMEMFKKF